MLAALSGRSSVYKFLEKYTFHGTNCCLSSLVSSAKREIEVVQRLRGLTEPTTGRTIQSLGVLQGIRVTEGSVKIQLDFFIPGYPHEKQVIEQLQEKLKDLSWVAEVTFDVASPKKFSNLNSMSMQDTALSKVGHIIGVSSCKGGVGKSTVAANLAATLSKMGLRIGLLDADVYGPSLPTLLPAVSPDVLRSPSNPKQVVPLRARHCPELRMLSFGHVNPNSGAPGAGGKSAAVVRGPIASRIINQLLLGTEWGELDYLVVDMPPGTGDIQITLSQSACLSGAVVVTTPHMLSLVDAAKGVAMFEKLAVPTLAVVENMAYFECEHGTRYYPFGRGGRDNLLAGCKALLGGEAPPQLPVDAQSADQVLAGAPDTAVENTGSYVRLAHCPLHSLPLVPFDPSAGVDALLPTVVARPDSEVAAMYEAMAHDVLVEVFKTQLGAFLIPTISVAKGGDEVLLSYYGASRTSEYAIPAMELRARDPVTGQVRLEGASTEAQAVERYRCVRPEKFDHKGQYGVSVVWSDGHFADIYPYAVLRSIAEDIVSKRKGGV